MRGLLAILLLCFLSAAARGQPRAQAELETPQGTVRITAERFETLANNVLVARGDVVIEYRDAVLTADQVTFDDQSDHATVEGNINLRRGDQWLRGSRAEIDLATDTGVLYDASGFTDRELYVQARILRKVGPTNWEAEDGFLTACEDFVPKWSFRISKASLDTTSWARASHTLFRIKKVPVFYLPYLLFPAERKQRSSGFLLPGLGNSNNKGRRVTQAFYLTLGRSADATVTTDYFSKRGFGYGFNFRARPNQRTRLAIAGFTIDDRLGQGGTSVQGTAETRFGVGFRAVADFNLVTDFTFRQVFSDNFFQATRPTDSSRFFLTNSVNARSFNVFFGREETVFPFENALINATPIVSLRLHGQRLFDSPLHVDLDGSVGGLNRTDALIETPSVSQRIDFFPQVYFSIPLFQGLRITPRAAFRNTFYSDSQKRDEDGLVVVGDSLNRQYGDFSIDVKGWGLARTWESGTRSWKHLIEPMARYRYTTGIDRFAETLRFDANDPIANTHEIEYALVNRFFVRESGGRSHEWLSLKIGQKYFFDPDFGGAVQPDAVNQFYPLYTLTGFPYLTQPRRVSPVTGVARFSPRAPYSFDLRGDFDRGSFRNFSLTGFVNVRYLSLASTYFVAESLDPTEQRNNQWQGFVGFGNFQRGFSASANYSWDIRQKQLLNIEARGNYFWDCCGITLEFQRFNIGAREERQIRFSFYLKGIGAFGTVQRPAQVF